MDLGLVIRELVQGTYSDPAALFHAWGCPSTGTMHLWAATHVMTSAIARALVPFDMTAIVPRSSKCHQDLCRVRPPRRTIEEWRRDVDEVAMGGLSSTSAVHVHLEAEPTNQYRTCGPDKLQRKYVISYLANALRVTINLKDQRHLKTVTVASVRNLHPRNFKSVVKSMDKSGHRDPAKDTLYRARVKFDVAAMIRHRRRSEAAGQINIYLVCDASP